MKKRLYRVFITLLAFIMLITANGFAEISQNVSQQVKLHYALDYLQNIVEFTGIGVMDEDGCYQFSFDTDKLNDIFVQIGERSLVFGSENSGLTEIDLIEVVNALSRLCIMIITGEPELAAALYEYVNGVGFILDVGMVSFLMLSEVDRLHSCLTDMGLLITKDSGEFILEATLAQLFQAASAYLTSLSQDENTLSILSGMNILQVFGMDAETAKAQIVETLLNVAAELAQTEMIPDDAGSVYLHMKSMSDFTLKLNVNSYYVKFNLNIEKTRRDFTLVLKSGGQYSYANASLHIAPSVFKLDAHAGDYNSMSKTLNVEYDNGELTASYFSERFYSVEASHKLHVFGDTAVYSGNWTSSGGSVSANAVLAHEGDKTYIEADISQSRGYAYTGLADLSAAYDTKQKTLTFGGFISSGYLTIPFEGSLGGGKLNVKLTTDNGEALLSFGSSVDNAGVLRMNGYLDFVSPELMNGQPMRMMELVLSLSPFDLRHDLAFTMYELDDDDSGTHAVCDVRSKYDGRNISFDYKPYYGDSIHLAGTRIASDTIKGFDVSGAMGDMPIHARAGIEKLPSANRRTVSVRLFGECDILEQKLGIQIPVEVAKTIRGGVRITLSVNSLINGVSSRLGGLLFELESTYVTPPAHVYGNEMSAETIAGLLFWALVYGT